MWALVTAAVLLQLGLGSALAARGSGHSSQPCHSAVALAQAQPPAPTHHAADAPAHTHEHAQAPDHPSTTDAGQAQGDNAHTLSHHCCATGVGSAVAWQGPRLRHSPPQAVRLGAVGRTLAPDLRPPIA